MARGGEPTLITSVQRALRLLEAVSEQPSGTTAKHLSRRTGIALPTTYHLLRTLVHEGYLEKLDDGAFIIGEQVAGLHSAAQGQGLRSRVRSVMTQLRDELNAAVYLAHYRDGEVVVTDIVDSPRMPRVDTWADFKQAAHATAIGKCLLSGLSRAERADHFDRYPPADLTPRTITRIRDLIESPEHPVVADTEEYSLGTACLAAPVLGADSPMTLAISFPARKLAAASFEAPLRVAAGEISRKLAVAGEFPTAG
ncbi:DNA-binding transcriptional regulator, IclR family [Saccharopolyspora antimicrobica]|uniref:Glycerol operon regulatory protein n=1 Tax=Saccharopolyspora antimicrobica TaxID=455193 RepID=A0A1I5HFT4_9PSEU|nr:IclR family transcriptional regulator [Saccharopolyspora antimicrobica]RKT85319.1 IclR family transcriptional regulator [Saccharopolyspora antimicrobica]SFO47077.1 DNA-binding transcriptional regulator, IclR family [Saccharopolyspora antimicrobica]